MDSETKPACKALTPKRFTGESQCTPNERLQDFFFFNKKFYKMEISQHQNSSPISSKELKGALANFAR